MLGVWVVFPLLYTPLCVSALHTSTFSTKNVITSVIEGNTYCPFFQSVIIENGWLRGKKITQNLTFKFKFNEIYVTFKEDFVKHVSQILTHLNGAGDNQKWKNGRKGRLKV